MKKLILLFFLCSSFPTLWAQNQADCKESFKEYEARRDSIRLSKYGSEYPAFTVVTLEGDTLTEKQLKGKVTLINLWFGACSPCVAEIPALNELYQKYKAHPEFRLISFTRDSPEEAQKWVRKLKISFPVSPVSVPESYRLNFNDAFPTNILVDTQGKIVLIKCGGPIELGNAAKAIRKLEEQIVSLFTR